MADYRYYTNLSTHPADEIKALGGKTDGLLLCERTGGYFDAVDTRFLTVLADYKIGAPIEATQDEAGNQRPTPLADLISNGIVGIYTTLEALMSPEARMVLGWTDKTLGAEYAGD